MVSFPLDSQALDRGYQLPIVSKSCIKDHQVLNLINWLNLSAGHNDDRGHGAMCCLVMANANGSRAAERTSVRRHLHALEAC